MYFYSRLSPFFFRLILVINVKFISLLITSYIIIVDNSGRFPSVLVTSVSCIRINIDCNCAIVSERDREISTSYHGDISPNLAFLMNLDHIMTNVKKLCLKCLIRR